MSSGAAGALRLAVSGAPLQQTAVPALLRQNVRRNATRYANGGDDRNSETESETSPALTNLRIEGHKI